MKAQEIKLIVVICYAALTTGETFDDEIKLPPQLKPCYASQPNIDQCFIDFIHTGLKLFKNKIPGFNIPPIDPIVRDFIPFSFKNDLVGFNYNSNLTNVRQYGLSRTKVRSLKMDFKAQSVKINVFVPKTINAANYILDITTPSAFFNVKSRGSIKITLKDYYGTIFLKWKYVKVNGEDYAKVTHIDLDIEARDMEIYFSDPIINEVWTNAVKPYWRLLYKDIFQSTRSAWEPFLIEQANLIADQIPIKLVLIRD